MAFPRFYSGVPGAPAAKGPDLPKPRRPQDENPAEYDADPGLVDAVNVALYLGQPLLLTGEPGTGKTQLAANLAHHLGLQKPLKFETKSTTASTDLFYHYDALARFHDAQNQVKGKGAINYITFRALGAAIILTHPAAVGAELGLKAERPGPVRSVVLIDEVDKAPRDLPNDVLNELDGLYFRIPELGGRVVEADPKFRPVVVLTSNSEKNLPDAFLRRCVYYNIPFPDDERLGRIVVARLGQVVAGQGTFIPAVLKCFAEFRNPATGLRKKPATAELLGWVRALRAVSDADNPLLSAKRDVVLGTLGAVAKNPDDQNRASAVCDDWLTRNAKGGS